jgi:hypothetical protein
MTSFTLRRKRGRSSRGFRAHFAYCLTPEFLGGDGEECSLLLRSLNGRRIRRRDSREMAYECLLENLPGEVLQDERITASVDFSAPTPGGNIGAVVAPTPEGFATLEAVLHEAGFTGVKIKRRDGLLDFYLE